LDVNLCGKANGNAFENMSIAFELDDTHPNGSNFQAMTESVNSDHSDDRYLRALFKGTEINWNDSFNVRLSPN
jgi:hypothetical protein